MEETEFKDEFRPFVEGQIIPCRAPSCGSLNALGVGSAEQIVTKNAGTDGEEDRYTILPERQIVSKCLKCGAKLYVDAYPIIEFYKMQRKGSAVANQNP